MVADIVFANKGIGTAVDQNGAVAVRAYMDVGGACGKIRSEGYSGCVYMGGRKFLPRQPII